MIRILIADDHDVLRAGVRAILSCEDVEVFEAADGAEAIAKALQCKPDLIILDLTMPVMDGYHAAIELRKLIPEVPVLFFTIHDNPQVRRLAEEAGARGFLHKSNAANALMDAVEELVVRKGTFFPESGRSKSAAP